MRYTIEFELEDDGRWIADVIDIPGAMVYGETKENVLGRLKPSLCA